MNVYLKRMWLILVAPAVAGLLAASFLYAPPVREAVIGQVLGYVEEATGIRVGYERLRVVFPLKVAACGAWVADGGDTLLRVGRLEVDARLIPLLSGTVAVDGVRLEEVVFDTGELIDGIALAGHAAEFLLRADTIDFAGEYARLEEIVMRDAAVRLTVCDTAAVDSTDAGVKQRIDLRSVRLENVALAYLMPCDSIYININVDKALISDVAADMGAERYEAASLEAEASEATYAVDHPETPEKPDAHHIRLSDVRLTLDSLLYTAVGEMRLRALGGSAREQSGITVKSLEGSLASDGVRLSVPSFRVTTDCSTAEIRADIPLSAFDTAKPAGNMLLAASAAIGKDDILRLVAAGAGSLPDGIAKKYPDRPVAVRMSVGGNAGELMLHRFDAVVTGGYRLHAAGVATGIADGARLAANVRFKVETDSSSFVAALSEAATGGRLRIPEKTRMDGRVSVDGSRYDALVTLREGDGAATLAAVCDSRGMEYDVRLTVDGLEPVHFLPADSIMHLSADLRLKGCGADITRPQTWAEAEGTVRRIAARGTALEDITLSGSLRSRRVQASVAVNDPFVRGKIEVDSEAGDGSIAGRITATVDTVDFHGLSLTDIPAGASFRLAAEVETDFAARHRTDIAASSCNV